MTNIATWPREPLGRHVKIRSGDAPANLQMTNVDGVPYVKVEDMNNCTKYQRASRENVINPPTLIPANSIIFPKRGAAIMNNKVRIAEVNIALDTNMMSLEPLPTIESEFLYYALTYTKLFKIADTSTIPQINNKHILPYKFLIPPLKEQNKIAEILSIWDQAIEATEQLIANSQAQKKALMQQLLTGKKRLPGFDGAWIQLSYGDLVKEVKRDVTWSDDDTYNLISVRRRSEGAFHRESLLGVEILTKNMRIAKAGDFVISKMQILHGASAIIPEHLDNFHISGSYISLRPKTETFDIRFLGWLSKAPIFYHQTYISSYGVHIEKMTFILKDFLKRKLRVPPCKAEQTAIVQVLDLAEQRIIAEQEKLAKLDSEKAALMQQLLTGKRRVKIEDAANA